MNKDWKDRAGVHRAVRIESEQAQPVIHSESIPDIHERAGFHRVVSANSRGFVEKSEIREEVLPASMGISTALTALLKRKDAEIALAGSGDWKQRPLFQLRRFWLGAVAAVGLVAATAMGLPGTGSAHDRGIDGEVIELPDPATTSLSPSYEAMVQHEQKIDPLMGIDLHESPQAWAKDLMREGHGFLALTAQIEAIAEKPYWDNCGVNVGVGYCIRARSMNYGEDQVREDLAKAGLPMDQIDILLDGNRQAQRTVSMKPEESLRLLFITQGDYSQIARDAFGAETFDALPSQKQQALSWMAYNLGDGLKDYRRLISAVQNQDWGNAMMQMTPHYNDQGEWKRNNRAAAYVMAVFASEGGLDQVLADPEAFETAVQRGISPVTLVNPELAKQLQARGTLPPSPYTIGDTLEDTQRWRAQQDQRRFSSLSKETQEASHQLTASHSNQNQNKERWVNPKNSMS